VVDIDNSMHYKIDEDEHASQKEKSYGRKVSKCGRGGPEVSSAGSAEKFFRALHLLKLNTNWNSLPLLLHITSARDKNGSLHHDNSGERK